MNLNNLKFISIAIAVFLTISGTAIAWKVLIPGKEPVLTSKYDLATLERSQSYFGKHQPFLLSGTTILWCNGSLVTFPSEVTVIEFNANLDRNDTEVTVCR